MSPRLTPEEYRELALEQARIADLMRLIPAGTETAIDIGARDGYLARKLADRIARVTALDLERPDIDDPRIACVCGDAAALDLPDRCFDLVFCAEVLEHIPSLILSKACKEMSRIAAGHVLIGVPYRQDIRFGRTTCSQCKGVNPPWGHVNSFDETSLFGLFSALEPIEISFVGQAECGTNALSAWLMDRAGNPYGTYCQDEPCIHCGAPLAPPDSRSILQRICARLSVLGRSIQQAWHRPHGNWVHVLFRVP